MKKISSALFCLLVSFFAFAQEFEFVQPSSINTAQYRSMKKWLPGTPPDGIQKYLIEKGNIIITTDTLSLPFVDDFSRNNLRSYKWIENHITDSFFNVIGTCLGPEGINTLQQTFMQDTAWYYSFDTTNQRVDSVAVPPIPFTYFGSGTSGCFLSAPQPTYYWPQYYTYTFDSTTGRPRDSLLVTANAVFINYAPVVYFAESEPGKLWFDNYAYINNTYPILPPTIGVATLDGLNEFGMPYNNANLNTYGTADVLTSLPINTVGLSESDSVYLSFFFEGKGNGDFPNTRDTLIVEFRDNSGQWRKVWSHKGYPSLDSVPQVFEQVLVKLETLPIPYSYFFHTFQFRFRNKASLYGNRDHWHIDYVILDKDRSAVDTLIQDVAFVYDHPNILKNFTQMPADQFNAATDLADTVRLLIRNNDPQAEFNPPATNFNRNALELYPVPGVVSPNVLQTFNAGPYSTIEFNPQSEFSIAGLPTDSLVMVSTVSITPTDPIAQNDTVRAHKIFSTTYAYDDGSSELSYGLSGLNVKKFGYEFTLAQPDTFVAFQIHFTETDDNVSDLVFSYFLWDSLKMNDVTYTDQPIYSFENKRPTYIDSVNGFATFVLDTPLIVSGKIYFGWAQTDTRSLQVGFDVNSPLGRSHMYVYTNGSWKPSTLSITGSPMIRLVFDSDYYGTNSVSSVVNLLHDDELFIYPNPAFDVLNFNTKNSSNNLTAKVYNVWGAEVSSTSIPANSINVRELPTGIYVAVITDLTSGKRFAQKFVKAGR